MENIRKQVLRVSKLCFSGGEAAIKVWVERGSGGTNVRARKSGRSRVGEIESQLEGQEDLRFVRNRGDKCDLKAPRSQKDHTGQGGKVERTGSPTLGDNA